MSTLEQIEAAILTLPSDELLVNISIFLSIPLRHLLWRLYFKFELALIFSAHLVKL
jgi:hypothetical protein